MTLDSSKIAELALSNGLSIVHKTLSMLIPPGDVAIVDEIAGQQYIDRQMGICWAQLTTEFFLFNEWHDESISLTYLELLQGAVVMYLSCECMDQVPIKRVFLRRRRAFASPRALAAHMRVQMEWLLVATCKELDSGKDLYESMEEALSMWWLKTWGFSGQPVAGLTMVHSVMMAKDWKACSPRQW